MLYFLNTALSLILALFFILFGVFAVLLALSPTMQKFSVELIYNNFWGWGLAGIGFIFIGLILSAYTLLTHRKSYITSKSGANKTSISETVLDEYLKSYFEKLFPEQRTAYRFLLKKEKLQIIADLPYISLDEQRKFLHLVESDLEELMNRYMGIHRILEISLSFDDKKIL